MEDTRSRTSQLLTAHAPHRITIMCKEIGRLLETKHQTAIV